MFAKLLKHEWQATKGVIGLLCVIILISGLTIGGAIHYVILADGGNTLVMEEAALHVSPETVEFLELLCILLITAGTMAVVICCAGSVFCVLYRFYRRCFSDEGYLTYTLPVTNHQILLSSIIISVVGVLAVVLAAAAAVGIVFGLVLLAANQVQEIIWADVWVSWENAWSQLVDSFWKNIRQFALVGFSGIFSALGEYIVLMLSITIGALIAKKHKILAAVGVYYGLGMAQSLVLSLLVMGGPGAENLHTLLATPGIMGIVLAVGGYWVMHWLTSKRLNLA